ncbi:hypothetical protein [Mucisphaera calidilacus]|uniref:Uncharacterized protein n=1 Tax=Mucisphaera calidilacus TaxID=2527982 RepID=A0A518C0N4_9BACT|nr:hypothetical protein [Mucisphaera calidilacus]QDU72760.1 hypothetical protein Pan265_26340 [Mucisphaera calidilacus]
MRRTRTIQVVSLITAAALLVGATALTPAINRQRLDLHLTYDIQTGDDTPATYSLLAACLGSFRGILANWAWYRIEMMKRDGDLYEANQLAGVITTLQPRFPQVWSFQAWNMAYNISVITKTPQERWDWVNKGIRLLREKGIPNNPKSIRLYHELAWILFHKMGQFSDDMNWYYKLQWAIEWEELLGAPGDGATSEQVAERMRPIAQAADRYFIFNRPPHEVRLMLERIAGDHAELEETVEGLFDIGSVRLQERLGRVRGQILRVDSELVDELNTIDGLVADQVERAAVDPLTLLERDFPAVSPVLAAMAQNGVEPDTAFLRAIGKNLIYARYYTYDALVEQANRGQLSPERQVALGLMLDRRYFEGLTRVIAFLRARAIWTEYRMDPQHMLRLIEKYGPMDWRHPAAHAIYWASLGVERTRVVFDQDRFDILNTDRNVIHGLQVLMFTGRLTHDPFMGSVDLLPDPRFIPSYEKAVFEGSERAGDVDLDRKGVISQFESGYENFLHKAIEFSYFYGDVEMAQSYYTKLRDRFGDKHGDRRYELALDEFVMAQMVMSKDMRQNAIALIDAMITRGLAEGLAKGDVENFARRLEIAEEMHRWYQGERDYEVPNAPRQRLQLEPFPVMLQKSYAAYMRQPTIPVVVKARTYAATPMPLRARTYGGFRAVLEEQCVAQGFAFERAFPVPEGFVPPEAVEPGAEPETPATVERQ